MLIAISQGTGVPSTGLATSVAHQTGPQRSVRGAGGNNEKGKAKRKPRVPKGAVPPGINWPNTCERFCAEMARIYFKPTGEVTNPETAYASLTNFIKEDLYLSVSNFFLLRSRSSFNKFVNLVLAACGEALWETTSTESRVGSIPDRSPQ